MILQKRVRGMTEGQLERFVVRARRAVGVSGTVNVMVTSSAAMRTLNRQFRGKDQATDVLSFPAPIAATNGRRAKAAGEIAISADIAAENAEALGHSAADEIRILILHGIVHLAGFDHERDHGEMARKELQLRHALKLPAGLIERNTTSHNRKARRSAVRRTA